MKYVLSLVVGLLLIISLLHLGVFGVAHPLLSSNGYSNLDTTGVNNLNFGEDYGCYYLGVGFNRNESSEVYHLIRVEQNFYNFFQDIDSNNFFRVKAATRVIKGYWSNHELEVYISKAEFNRFRTIGMWFVLLYFSIQSLICYFIFRLLISYWRKHFYDPANPRRFLILGILVTIFGGFLYLKGLIQQFILNTILGEHFFVQAKEVWEYFPYILILGLFLIVVARFYKDAVILKEQNDLTI